MDTNYLPMDILEKISSADLRELTPENEVELFMSEFLTETDELAIPPYRM